MPTFPSTNPDTRHCPSKLQDEGHGHGRAYGVPALCRISQNTPSAFLSLTVVLFAGEVLLAECYS